MQELRSTFFKSGRPQGPNRHRWALAGFPCHTTVRTGPYTAVRRVERSVRRQTGKPERVEEGVWKGVAEGRAAADAPGAMGAARRLGG